jgi:hypothetical protein
MMGLVVPEGIETFSRLDEELLTPTPEFTWRGIWITNFAYGDEFSLFIQDRPSRIEAVKLTGNASVPRGEYVFLVDNLDTRLDADDLPEYVGRLDLPVVQVRFQQADTNFVNRRFEAGKLVLFGNDAVVLFDRFGIFVASFTRVDWQCLIKKNCAAAVPAP